MEKELQKTSPVSYEKVIEVVKVKQVVCDCEVPFNLKVMSSNEIAQILMQEIGQDCQESLVLLGLNTKNRINVYSVVFKGSVNSSICHPREIVQRLIMNNCARFIIVHNHPSNNPEPSEADDTMTKKMKEVGKLLDIAMLDHIIVGHDTYYSYNENGRMK